jgi:hypothetical protein
MIEYHGGGYIRGFKRAAHVLVDDAGVRSLAEMTLAPDEQLSPTATITMPSPGLIGYDVYLNECPCMEGAFERTQTTSEQQHPTP